MDLFKIKSKMIEYSLKQALVWHTKKMSQDLFEDVLKENIDFAKSSLKESNDDYILFLLEEEGEVSILLILKSEEVLANEEAKEKLKKFWPKDAYKSNLKLMIPNSAKQLAKGIIPNYGFKVKDDYSTETI